MATTDPETHRFTASQWLPVLLVRAAHPRLAVATAAGLALAATVSGRPGREVALVGGTVLVGQSILGWHNDLVDAGRDRAHETPGKPVAERLLEPGTVWFTVICAGLLVIPLSLSSGVVAGCCYLLALAVGLLGNLVLRGSVLSWLPWAVSYALLPAYLSYGGWGGAAAGDPPTIAITVVAALLGIGVHFLCALPGLVADHEDDLRHLPLRVALRTGAPRLLVISTVWTALMVVLLAVVGATAGLRR